MFPSDITIEECREAANFSGFRENTKEDYIIFNYDYAFRETFPDPLTEEDPHLKRIYSIRRECRGIIFDKETGAIVARRFHKFFNIHEMEECYPENIDMTQPHVVLEKLDGSLASPFYTGGVLRYGTKMGVTTASSEIEEYVRNSGIDFDTFCAHWISEGYTPLFEWICASSPVLIEYEHDSLSLCAIRNMNDGNYIPVQDMFRYADEAGIPRVKDSGFKYGVDYNDANQLLELVRQIEGFLEGYVLVFESGLFYKMKTAWYVEKSKRSNKEFSTHEKDLWVIVLDGKLDDMVDIMGPRRFKKIDKFGKSLFAAIENRAAECTAIVEEAKAQGMSRSEYVAYVKKTAEDEQSSILFRDFQSILFKIFDSDNHFDQVFSYVRSNCTSRPKLERMREFMEGVKIKL